MSPRTLAPFFTATALFHLASIATRYDVIAAEIPANVASAILFAQLPLLLVAGYFEGMLDYGKGVGPAWMRIKSRPVKWSFTFAFIYLVLVILQTWNISLGPIDPTPPKSFPEWERAAWFAGFSVGMFFPNYLAATSTLIPALRGITAPLRKLPSVLAVAIAAVIGVAAGFGLVVALASAKIGSGVGSANDFWQSLQNDPQIALPIALAMACGPVIVGLVAERFGKKEAAA
ncbi:MAG TPA: hypothetical protein VGH28_19175 [Polyangiaceae bacterium]|jgi:MFS family permease